MLEKSKQNLIHEDRFVILDHQIPHLNPKKIVLIKFNEGNPLENASDFEKKIRGVLAYVSEEKVLSISVPQLMKLSRGGVLASQSDYCVSIVNALYEFINSDQNKLKSTTLASTSRSLVDELVLKFKAHQPDKKRPDSINSLQPASIMQNRESYQPEEALTFEAVPIVTQRQEREVHQAHEETIPTMVLQADADSLPREKEDLNNERNEVIDVVKSLENDKNLEKEPSAGQIGHEPEQPINHHEPEQPKNDPEPEPKHDPEPEQPKNDPEPEPNHDPEPEQPKNDPEPEPKHDPEPEQPKNDPEPEPNHDPEPEQPKNDQPSSEINVSNTVNHPDSSEPPGETTNSLKIPESQPEDDPIKPKSEPETNAESVIEDPPKQEEMTDDKPVDGQEPGKKKKKKGKK